MTETNARPILELPVLPVRGSALFPHTLMPVTIGRVATLEALAALGDRRQIAVIAQREARQLNPSLGDLHEVGTLASLVRTFQSPEQPNVVVLLQGIARIRVHALVQEQPYLRIEAELLSDEPPAPGADERVQQLSAGIRSLFREIVESTLNLDNELVAVADGIESPAYLADFVTWTLPDTSAALRQELLETRSVEVRLLRLVEELNAVRDAQKERDSLRADIEHRVDDHQRKRFLREQLRAIQRELGEPAHATESEHATLHAKLASSELPDEVRAQAEREWERLTRIPEASPEYTVTRTYLDWLLAMPWGAKEMPAIDMQAASAILDDEHYDLDRVKDRILEYLAVVSLTKDLRGPILCFVGPPGVGKTSLGRSIAHALGRPFRRLSLGGMHDEAEIRGHRRTYVGAQPGQILQALRQCASRDPVLMLDEVDKLGRDFRGDPAAALLEVLDPAQNHAFRDNYLDLPFDLSKVLFICTANTLDTVPAPLLDRLEVIALSGYIDEDKLQIAKRYLVPRQVRENGLHLGGEIAFQDDALQQMVRHYTHEAGVRQLEQQIASVCRKRAREVASGRNGHLLAVDPRVVRTYLGPPRYRSESELAERTRTPGVAVAMAWTPAGGEVLFVEATRLPQGRGEFLVTGQVREVMQESARTALSWLRAHAPGCGVDLSELRESDVHVHIPAGAIPKDGPSAGIVLVCSLVSLFRKTPIRPYVAMTGEITLSGRVLPVGGIREKVLGAKRSGVRAFILPSDNEPDVLEEIPAHLREGLTFHFVDHLDAALELAFPHKPAPVETGPAAPVGVPAAHVPAAPVNRVGEGYSHRS